MRSLAIFLVCVVVVATACSSESDEKQCALVGCENGVRLERSITVAAADVPKLTLTVCRNGECSSGKPSLGAGPCGLAGQLRPSACSLTQNGATASLLVQLPSTSPRDGDEHTFKLVRDDTGQALVEVNQKVVYTTNRPNGVDCEPTCKFATL